MHGRSKQNALPVWNVQFEKLDSQDSETFGQMENSWPNHKISGNSGSPKSIIQADDGQNSELVKCWFAPFGAVLLSGGLIPNSEKQKQLPNTQWMKYVYCPALFTLEVGRASCNHGTNTVWKKRFSKSVCDTVANMPEARAKGSLPKELLSASLFTSST